MFEPKKSTRQLVESLKSAEWLSSCGKPLKGDLSSNYAYLDKTAAKESLLTEQWENVFYEASNGCREILSDAEMDRWDDLVDAVNELIAIPKEAAIKEISKHFEIAASLPIDRVVSYTFRTACMELEYAPTLGPGFFCELCEIMISGRLPCGLSEKFPDGHLLVY